MSVFVTDKRIETLNYDLICTRKDLKEMTLLVQTNSTTIADLLGLIREQNKSLTELRRDVESLKTELGVLKKGNCVVEKVDQSEVSVESKSTVEEEIKPEDKPFRHFEFDKSWEELPAVKEWGDSKVVQIFEPMNYGIAAHYGGLFNCDLDKKPVSIEECIKKLEKHLNTQPSLNRLQCLVLRKLGYTLSDFTYNPSTLKIYKEKLQEHLKKKSILGYFLDGNNTIKYLNFDEKNFTLSFQLL